MEAIVTVWSVKRTAVVTVHRICLSCLAVAAPKRCNRSIHCYEITHIMHFENVERHIAFSLSVRQSVFYHMYRVSRTSAKYKIRTVHICILLNPKCVFGKQWHFFHQDKTISRERNRLFKLLPVTPRIMQWTPQVYCFKPERGIH